MNAVTFIRTKPGTHDPTTERFGAPTSTSITGNAIEVQGDPDHYRQNGLSLDTMPTLLFSPTGYPLRAHTAEFVQPGDSCEWVGRQFVVKNISGIIAPDGFVVAARIVIAA